MNIKFTKTGILILENENGEYVIFENNLSLKEISNYIWKENSLKEYRLLEDAKEFKKNKTFKIPEIKEDENRLRNIHDLLDDPYFKET